jgi:hypothetical protein
MTVLLPTLKDEADLSFKYNHWMGVVSVTKTGVIDGLTGYQCFQRMRALRWNQRPRITVVS